MHSIILIFAYGLNNKLMLNILLINPKLLTSMQQKHELQFHAFTFTRASSYKYFAVTSNIINKLECAYKN